MTMTTRMMKSIVWLRTTHWSKTGRRRKERAVERMAEREARLDEPQQGTLQQVLEQQFLSQKKKKKEAKLLLQHPPP